MSATSSERAESAREAEGGQRPIPPIVVPESIFARVQRLQNA